ncbi:MAG: winged helix-turn-helix transcriptional regulator [Sandaracinaceae bacterium]|nr:winged helix-turn-helix transcriptional regulator [Sandaracinaceae bacterium]
MPAPPDPLELHRAAYARAQAGDYRDAEARLAEPRPQDPTTAAWRNALGASLWLAAPDAHPAPDVPPAEPGAEDPRAIVQAAIARAAWLAHRFEPHPVDRGGALADALAEEQRGLLELGRGEAAIAHARFEAARRRASDPSAVVDAAAWAAYASLATGDVEEGLARARRASRMARTESLLASEYLASSVLARARRHAGAPHLATRVLTQLLDVAPSPWRPWLTYELALAGGAVADHAGSPSEALAAVFAAARAGDRAAFDAAAAAYAARVEGFAPLSREARAIVEALDPDAPATTPFARGVDALSPHGVVDPREGDGAVACVLARPSGARRILSGAAALVEAPRWEPAESALREHRSLTLLSALALAPSLEIEEAFEAVYGFAFTSAKHDAVLRTLLHRTRALLDDAAEIDRAGATLTLRVRSTLLIPDPRCARPADQRVLAALAHGGGALGARELAQGLRVPLRTVQLALKRLVDDGAARVERDGRRVEYVVEDSAFCEPTLSRLGARPSPA